MKRIIAVTQRAVLADHQEARDALAQEWTPVFERLEIIPLLIPNAVSDVTPWLQQLGIHAVLLTGGGDVPSLAGENSASPPLEIQRMKTEVALLDWARAQRKPVLGVCRGMQVMNAWLGGALVRRLKDDVPGAGSHVGQVHDVELMDESLTRQLGRKTTRVNSFHNQGVTASTLARDAHVMAQAAGEVVEAFSHSHGRMIGIQWHPERAQSDGDLDQILFRRWLGHGAPP